jgi:hypothetical protein
VAADHATISFSGYTVLCTAPDGSLSEAHHGLCHRDTRVLSRYRLTLDDVVPELVSASKPESDRWEAVLRVPRAGGSPEGPLLPQDALEVHIRRRVGPGMLELLAIRNHSAVPCETTILLEVDADFADVAEIDGRRQQHGRIDRTADSKSLCLRYVVEHDGRRVERGLQLLVADASSPPKIDPKGVRFEVRHEPLGEWQATLRLPPLHRADCPDTKTQLTQPTIRHE